jgi:hypothetical protein
MGKQDDYIEKELMDEEGENWVANGDDVDVDQAAAARKADLNARRKLEEYRERKAMQEMLQDFDTYTL